MPGLYLPPVLVAGAKPPQMIISLPLHTAVCHSRAMGALVVLVAIQLSVVGLYLAAGIQSIRIISSPKRSFQCRSKPQCETHVRRRRIGGAGRRPHVRARIVSAARIQRTGAIISAPDRSFRRRSQRLVCDRSGQRGVDVQWCWSPSRYHRCTRSLHPTRGKRVIRTQRCHPAGHLRFAPVVRPETPEALCAIQLSRQLYAVVTLVTTAIA